MALGGHSQNLDSCYSHDRGTETGRREMGGDMVRAEWAGEQKFGDVTYNYKENMYACIFV